MAVLLLPVVLLKSAKVPLAVFLTPVLFLKKRTSANRSILVCSVGKEGPSANPRVELAFLFAQKRKQANRRVECAGGETKKRILPFRCVPSRIAAVWRRANGLRIWQKPSPGEQM